ncbi:hypothetical protein RHOER0001_1941 [Rhodococcus erythropolis SK121]|nr:hypothetical protein RHOER0001_1941 [Rhodococcus erythropolis SK121]
MDIGVVPLLAGRFLPKSNARTNGAAAVGGPLPEEGECRIVSSQLLTLLKRLGTLMERQSKAE